MKTFKPNIEKSHFWLDINLFLNFEIFKLVDFQTSDVTKTSPEISEIHSSGLCWLDYNSFWLDLNVENLYSSSISV